MFHKEFDILYSNEPIGSDNISLEEYSNIIYPMNNEDFLHNNIENIARTNLLTKDSSDIRITEDDVYRAIKDEFDIDNYKDIKSFEKDENNEGYRTLSNIYNIAKKGNIKRKPGRKSGPIIKGKYKRKIHKRNDIDNILTKLQVHFMNFILNIANDAIKQVLKKSKKLCFKHIDYNFKKNINYTYFENLKNLPIKEILQEQISSKYKILSKDKNYNKEVYKKVISLNKEVNKSDWLKDFFELKYITLFKKYYNNTKKLISLNFNGKDIKLTEKKTKSFNDLIETNFDLKENLIKVCNEFYFNNNEYLDIIPSNNYFRVDKLKKIK